MIMVTVVAFNTCTKDKMQVRPEITWKTTSKLYFLLGCNRTRPSPRSCLFRSFSCRLLPEEFFSEGPSVDIVSFVPKIMGDTTVIHSFKIAYNGIL